MRDLNHRLRAFALQHLTSAAAVDWVAQFTHLADVAVVRRLLALTGGDTVDACWCFCGSSGREESLIGLAERVARQVSRSGRAMLMEPMPANERRIIHLKLREHPGVFTESSGEGHNRRVEVLPRD